MLSHLWESNHYRGWWKCAVLQAEYHCTVHGTTQCKFTVDFFFPNWRNSVQITTLQMIGHALLNTNFNTFQSHLQGKYNG